MKANKNKQKKVAIFHIGRGGPFNNGGHVTFEGINREFDPSYYGINISFGFKNREMTRLMREDDRIDVDELACNVQILTDEIAEAVRMINEDNGETFSISDLGEAYIRDADNGSLLCTVAELNSGSGRVELDGDYDSYYWMPISELEEKDFVMMTKSNRFGNIDYDVLQEVADVFDFDEAFITLLKDGGLFEKFAKDILYGYSQCEIIEMMINNGDLEQFTTGEDLDCIGIEHKGNYYSLVR